MLETLSTATPAKGGETMPEWNEKEIVGRAQGGDMEACDALIRQYQERIYAKLRSFAKTMPQRASGSVGRRGRGIQVLFYCSVPWCSSDIYC